MEFLNDDGVIIGLEDCDYLLGETDERKPDCIGCYRFEDCINSVRMDELVTKRSVLSTIEDMDKALDADRTIENYKALLIECIINLCSCD